MDNLTLAIAAFFTIISPLLIARAKNDSWATITKVAIPIVVSLVIAGLYLYFEGLLSWDGDLIVTFLTVFGAQQLVYSTILKQFSTTLEARGQTPALDAPKHLEE